MSDLVLTSNTDGLTMSSREIAQVVESRHDNVKRTMESLRDRRLITFTQSEEKTSGRTAVVYSVGKRDSYVVVAQLSPEFTARLVDRWQELESRATALPDFNNPAIAARAWADEVEGRQAALAQLEHAKPAMAFVERYVSAESGAKGFRQVCKLLNAKQAEFRQFLRDQKIMYPLGGEWAPYQAHIDAGRFVVRAGVAENDHAYNTAKFTPKGINWIAGKWAINELQGDLQ